MKKIVFLALAALGLGLYSCDKEPVNNTAEEAQPTITLEEAGETANTVTFTLKTTDAKEARYMVLEDDADMPTLDTILSEGTEVTLDENGSSTVTAEGLEAETEYMVVAAARNITKTAGSNTLYVTTASEAALALSVEIVQVTHESMNFRFNHSNATKISYLVLYADKNTPDVQYVLLNGEEVDVNNKESVEVADLENSKAYKLVVAAEGAGQTTLVEEAFETNDDPDQVISHNYTRARGTKYGSSYFLMFSYEDANEADNFAYNEKTLSLDFYGDPDKDYLPAGTYEVKESTEPNCVSSYRYSTYGYDNGVQLKSGQVVVAIDAETKAYSFDIDLFLKDGRHLKATYTGDVDNMPVIDITTITTTFATASASTSDNGKNWTLNLEDAEGNKAKFDICNAFDAPYLANNSYVISTSAEALATRAAEAGQFDAETSLFTVAGEGDFKFLTGSLHVSIDWDAQTYTLTFYGTLEDNYVIEAEYVGAIDGISLAQSEEIIDVMLTGASATGYDDNTNWYTTFVQSVEGVETYRLVMDFYCPASDYLLAGYYRLGNSVEGRYIGVDATSIRIAGEGQYNAVEATASVSVDMSAKTYTFDMSFKIQDGRTFKLAYVGEVTGMTITEPEDAPDTIEWTSVTARRWYSDNWNLNVADAEAKYVFDFDLRTGNDEAKYLLPGTYILGEEGQHIDFQYSKFNGNSKAFKDAKLILVYHDDSDTYDVEFDVTLADGTNFKGAYSGPIAGTPVE